MSTMLRGLGPILAAAACVAALPPGAMPAAPTAAQPVSDVRDVQIKVRDLKLDCQSMDGSAASHAANSYTVYHNGLARNGTSLIRSSKHGEAAK